MSISPQKYFEEVSAIAVTGYQIRNKIYESDNSIVYRAWNQQHQSVILKVLKADYPTAEELIKYRQEYKLTHFLDLEGVIKADSLKKYQNTLIIIFEDFGGESLNILGNHSFTLKELLKIAIMTTTSLGRIHAANIIHKDINPSNIVFNRATEQLKIIDFGIATVFSKEITNFNPNVLEGTLAYISPEQTGRMNRCVDYRTDFYSLGATFYELLTGRLPFETADVMELIHCHIADQPIPPHELNSNIPKAISDIVMKLLAKTAEERYQSAWGIKTDLEICLNQLENHGLITEFIVGEHDVSEKLQIPQKLYGREREIETLINAFERMSSVLPGEATPNQNEIILVHGYSGVGKTSLVQEIYKPITRQGGYFVKGKFEQYQRNIPYFAIIKAFQELVRLVLTESAAQLAQWREKLLAACGDVQVIIDVIPELELILGKQPVVPVLTPIEAKNRFRLAFQNLIRVFSQPEHPLVIFLDDLQWADSASLQLIQLFITATDNQHLFFIGAYRDNEVSKVHPLMLTLDEIQQKGVKVTCISLSSLNLSDINQLISDTLNYPLEITQPLAELVQAKTDGNPFFINEFLKSLAAEKLIKFELNKGWEWDLKQIQQSKCITDNVVDLLIGKIKKMDVPQAVLQIAACIGNCFELSTLAKCLEKSAKETVDLLHEAIAADLIIPLNNDYKAIALDIPSVTDRLDAKYKFVHDRVRQAVYSQIPEQTKLIIHRQVGRVILQNTPLDKQPEKIFDIVHHLNSITLINTDSERHELAQLNLIAGKKAKASVAYESAFKYLMIGIGVLNSSRDSWDLKYDLTLELYVEAAEAAYLCADFEQMESLVQIVLVQAKTLLDQVKAYELKILACIAQNQSLQAVEIAIQLLRLLGVNLSEKPNRFRIGLEAIATKLALRGKSIDSLIALPEMTQPYKLAAMRIIGLIGSPAYNATPKFMPLLAFKGIKLSLKYGNTSMSAYGYASYGVILCGVLGDIDAGYQFGKLALHLLERFNAKELKARTFMVFNNFIRHWKEHIKAGLKPLLEAYSSGLETGDIEFAAYSAYIYCYHSYTIGKELSKLAQEMVTYSHAISQLGQETALNLLEIYQQVVFNLLEKAEKTRFIIGSNSEEMLLNRILSANHVTAIFHFYCQKAIVNYLFEQYEKAVENLAMASRYLDGVVATINVPLFYFYDSLVKLAVCASVSTSEQRHLLKKVAANQKKMKKWADHAPMNYLHKFYLVAAQQYRVVGECDRAMDYYDRAIALASENEYINEQALAHELAAHFYLELGKVKIAQLYMKDAHYCYSLWGAVAKVKYLESKYPELIISPEDNQIDIKKSITRNYGNLDVYTVIKASQVISNEIVEQQLLNKLMDIVIENAGAESGFLILLKSKLIIVAAGGASKNVKIDWRSQIVENSDLLPISVINYVARTKEDVVLKDAINELFVNDDYIQLHQPKSVLCTPILNQSQLIGIVYLENNLVSSAFSNSRIEVVRLLCAQAAISLKNAQLYQDLQQSEAKERERAKQLELSLQQLQQAQSQLTQAQEKLMYNVFHDSLTGLPNRAWFIKQLAYTIKLSKQHPNYLYAVLIIDLDRFKVVNDSLGHLLGDELLKSVATRLKAALRSTDIVARLGGDEFAIMLAHIKDVAEAIGVAQRIQEQLRQPYQLYDDRVFMQTSIGITFSTMNYERAIDVLRDANAARYHAKEQFKGRYQIFTPSMQTRAIARLQLENDLRQAIEQQELFLHYQPIIELSSSRLSGFEALVRWNHPLKGSISPADFIPVAEETGLINSLGWWVLQQACLQLYTWQQRFDAKVAIALNVNLSVQQLKQADVIDRIEQILQTTKLSGDCLKLEITESGLLETTDLEPKILEQLKALGIRLCIDDFGTGYSSLSRLHDLPIDTLKIDRSFISRLETNSSTEIVQTIITLAHSLGIDAVAEGIETSVQLEKLQQLGCDLGQGFLFSKPVDSQTASLLL